CQIYIDIKSLPVFRECHVTYLIGKVIIENFTLKLLHTQLVYTSLAFYR
ncbi:MAG: hypothetical protein ACI952_001086, partial [Flavobacteriales bacterium]